MARVYDVACPNGHQSEYECPIGEITQRLQAGVPCEQCSANVQVRFKPASVERGFGILYNCGGFYGSVPTREAHNTGMM